MKELANKVTRSNSLISNVHFLDVQLTAKETMIMDPIHGFINISEYDVIQQVVESKYFQRLRRLAQLGLTSSVYPNATHSRFAHCLGVMHVFLTLFDAIARKEPEEISEQDHKRKMGAVTALLHDVGHGPFSHASENILDKDSGGFVHEDMTCKIIQEPEVADILDKNGIKPSLVCDLIKHTHTKEWILVSQLVSSQLDADRLDYLLRDSYFTGVVYGRIELHRIANTLEIWRGNTDDSFNGTAVTNPKGVSAVENYILGRHLMYDGVYFHKMSRGMESLLSGVFKRASELPDDKTGLSRVIRQDVKTTPDLLYKMDDYSCMGLFHEWVHSEDEILKDLSTRILNRKPLKSITISTDKYTKLGAMKLGKLPGLVEACGYDKNYYYFEDNYGKSAYDVYSPDELEDRDEFSPANHIMTPDEDNRLVEISSQSRVIEALSKLEPKKIRIFVPDKVLTNVRKVVNS